MKVVALFALAASLSLVASVPPDSPSVPKSWQRLVEGNVAPIP